MSADWLKVTGNLTLTGVVDLILSDLAATSEAVALGTTFSLINYTGTWNNGLFSVSGISIANAGIFTDGLNMWRLDYNATSGGLNFGGAGA